MGKRLFDVIVGCVALVCALPIILLIMTVLWVVGPQVFFFQERMGLNGRPFILWKFCSMWPGSDRIVRLATADDERITPIGRLLRRYHLDELPQFVNVIRGDMSLVGPRPIPYAYMKEIADTPDYRRRLSVRPGLTGLVQVHGRAWFFRYGRKRAFRLDAFYAARHSALLDIIILLQTVLVVLKGKGV